MARSFTNIKAISALVAEEFSNSLARRGYAATAQSAGRVGASMSGKMGSTKSGEEKAAAREKVSWVPDPVTGYYKPENIKEIDVAELRPAVLGKN
uniref:Uncharacterized protein n=1 Tax=Lotus japonicus TaxID=34305 RepID=I3T7Z8_LOTJA|nr:unknown [Lotus japonicus]